MSHQIANPDALSEYERRLVDDASIEEPWALLEEFRDLERVSGSADEERAAEYITGRLDACGVDYTRYDPELYISQPGDASIEIADTPFVAEPVKTVSFSEAGAFSGELVYVGEAEAADVGEEAAESSQYHAVDISDPYSDLDRGDVAGKFALTAAGSLSIRAIKTLQEKGAKGVVSIHPHRREPHSGIATWIWGGAPPYRDRDTGPDIPVINVKKPDGEHLKEVAERRDGVEVEIETEVTTDWMECPIVVAEIEADRDTDEFALLHGHYDSWYVGITDNATGDAGLLECARLFEHHSQELERNLRVAWWPGHSTGRYAGSTWYADEFAVDIAENCVAHVDMDSPGAKDSAEYVDMSCWMPESHPLVSETITDVTDAPYRENRPRRAGDYSFNNIGVTGMFTLSSNIPAETREERGYHPVGGCGGNSDAWHLSTDTIEKAGEDELLRDIRMYAVLVSRILTAEVLPLDHERNLRRHRDIVEEYQAIAGDAFDFGPTVEAIESLRQAVTAFRERVESGEISPEAANDAIMALSRTLTRLNFTADGQFEQDPAH
ncbi:MAG: M28 family peptidase, partial [Halolamina sp.]